MAYLTYDSSRKMGWLRAFPRAFQTLLGLRGHVFGRHDNARRTAAFSDIPDPLRRDVGLPQAQSSRNYWDYL